MLSVHKVQYAIVSEMLVQLIDAKCNTDALKPPRCICCAQHMTWTLCCVQSYMVVQLIACILPLPHYNSAIHHAFYQALKINCILGAVYKCGTSGYNQSRVKYQCPLSAGLAIRGGNYFYHGRCLVGTNASGRANALMQGMHVTDKC